MRLLLRYQDREDSRDVLKLALLQAAKTKDTAQYSSSWVVDDFFVTLSKL